MACSYFPTNRILLLKFARCAATVWSVMIPIKGGADSVNSAHPTGQFDPARLIGQPSVRLITGGQDRNR